MLMMIYSLYDRRAGEYGQPQLAVNDAVMRRSLLDGLPQGSLPMAHPEDFDLVSVGSMDTVSGVVRGSEVPQLVDNVATMLARRAEVLP